MSRLPHSVILEIHSAAVAVHLDRHAVLAGIHRQLVASLPIQNTAAAQLLSDLSELNQIEHMNDGSDPLATWLKNAVVLSEPRTESYIFSAALGKLEAPQPAGHVSRPQHKQEATDHAGFGAQQKAKQSAPQSSYQYDVALSFAGEDRPVAEGLAQLLIKGGVRVFYDNYEKASLWGKDLYQHLQVVYRDRARYCVIFVSSAYARKLWTKHELKQAQARAFMDNSEYILPLRLDDTEIPGLNVTVGYVDLRSTDIAEVAELVIAKLNE